MHLYLHVYSAITKKLCQQSSQVRKLIKKERQKAFISHFNGGLPDKAFAHRAGHPWHT